MSAFPQDLKFGFCMLVRKRLLTIVISLSPALGIGANSAVFSLVDAILFRPLNVANSERLVSIYTSDYSGTQHHAPSYPDFVDFSGKTNVFESLTAFTEISATLQSEQQSERASE
jgi:putative ABC transport system permease protein